MQRRAFLEAAAALAAFAALALVARVWSLEVPLSEDTGAYLYIGGGILDGEVPYADAADNKGPVTYLLFAVLDLLSSGSTVAMRLMLVLACALAALAVAARVRRAAGPWPGAAAGAALALLGSTPFLEGEDPNTEQLGIAPLAGAWWLAARGGRRSAAGAGALLAGAVLMNPGFAAFAPVIALELWLAGERPGAAAARERAARLGAALAGGALVATAVLGWLLLAGAIDDMWTQVVDKAGGALSGDSVEGGFASRPLLEGPPRARGLFVLGAAGAALALSRPRLRAVAAAALLWTVLGWLRVKLASYEFTHHYYAGLPGIAAGIALGGTAAWELAGERVALRRAVLVGAAALAGLLAWRYVADPSLDQLDRPVSERVRFPQYALAYPVGDALRERTAPGETVLVAGNHPTVYWRAERRAPNRFFAEYALVEPAYVEERRRALRADPPDAVVLMGGSSLFEGDVRALLRGGTYRRAWSEAGAQIWLRSGARS